MKVAIIGSGVSGLAAAYLLAPHHEVTIYEKDSRIGGHAHTIFVEESGKKIPVDNGFMVFNPERYPNFVALLDAMDVRCVNTNMSLGVNIPGQIAYQSSIPNGIFAVRRNVFNIRYWKFLFEVFRFRRLAKKTVYLNKGGEETIKQFVLQHGFSNDLTEWFLYPNLAAIWSIREVEKVGDFPALSTFVFMNNHKLLDSRQPTWKTIKGGSIEYVSRIKDFIENNGSQIILNSKITKIIRSNKKVKVVAEGREKVFDYIIFSTHADVTKKILSDITSDEKKALDMFVYSKNKMVLHKDAGVVPKNKNLLAAWNYTSNGNRLLGVFTYCMNILQHIAKTTPIFVTLNPAYGIDADKIYATEDYEHPQYNLASLEGQKMIERLQGKNRTLFAGAYLGYGFHEDGVVSAIKVTKALGVEPLWTKNI